MLQRGSVGNHFLLHFTSRFVYHLLWTAHVFSRHASDSVIAHVVRPLPHGNEFQHITYLRGAVDHDKASVIF